MDFDSFLKTVKRLPLNNSVLIRGRHGIGKSEVVYQLGDYFNLPVMERRISQMTEGDLIGLPFKTKDDKSTKFLPLDWFVKCMKTPHLIFLDEIDRGSYEVQQACFELILDRSIQGNKIHKDCRIYSAVNGGLHGANYNINEMDPAMIDRFFVVDLEPSVDDWIKWARENGVHPKVIDFIDSERKQSQTPLEHKASFEIGKIYPSRRSWKKLSDCFLEFPELLKSPKEKANRAMIKNLAGGFVGPVATSEFLKYLKAEKTFTAEMILNEFPKHAKYFENPEVRTDAAFLNNICDKIYLFIEENDGLTKKRLENMYEFWLTMAGELKMKMYSELTTGKTIPKSLKTAFVEKCAPDMVDLVS